MMYEDESLPAYRRADSAAKRADRVPTGYVYTPNVPAHITVSPGLPDFDSWPVMASESGARFADLAMGEFDV